MESGVLSSRQNQLSHLETYLNEVDIEVTMILQSLQWDRKHLLEHRTMVPCQYNANHRVPPDKLQEHENECFLKSQGYMLKDLLPDPVDPNANTLVKLNAHNIAEIIQNASRCQALFKTGPGCNGIQPLSLEHLQATYTADERRAIYDAVVQQVPSCHDLSDLALLSSQDEASKDVKVKSRLEILAELRDMKRRRTKYRVAAKTRNYSDVLRDVINTQMELYTQAQDNIKKQIKKEKHDIDGEVVESCNRSSDKAPKHSTVSNQTSKIIEDINKDSHNYESRKRRYDDTDDEYKSKYSKTHECDTATTSKSYEYDNMRHASRRLNDYNRSNKRDTHTAYSRGNRDKHREEYERGQRHNEKDNDYRNKNQTKAHNINSANDIKKVKNDWSRNGSIESPNKCYDYKISQERHYSSKGYYSNMQGQKLDQYQNSKLRHETTDRNVNKIHTDKEKVNKTVNTKRDKHSHGNNSYSSASETEYMEKSKYYNKAKRTPHHNHRAHYSKAKDNEREKHYNDCPSRSSHDTGNQKSSSQGEGNIEVKNEKIINSMKKYYRHDESYKEKYRREENHALQRQERKETVEKGKQNKQDKIKKL